MKRHRFYIVGIFVTLLITLGALSYSTISTVNRVTENITLIIDHPYSVSNAAKESYNKLHQIVYVNVVIGDFTPEIILQLINDIESELPKVDSLNAIIFERYLGPEQDIIDLMNSRVHLKTDLDYSKTEALKGNAAGLEFYGDMIDEAVVMKSILTKIGEFADTKRDQFLAESIENKETYLFRLQLYIVLMIGLFIAVSAIIGITIRQKLQLISENENLSDHAKRNTERIKRINKIFQNQAANEQEFLDYALNQGIELTESKIGYFYFFDNDTQEFILNTWSKGVMDECSVVNPKTRYSLESTGIWGEAVRQKKAFIINDFEKFHPKKKGYPKGHVHLSRFMTAPIYENNEIVAVVGVANKETDYTQDDLEQLQLLMNQIWNINKARQREIENERFVRAVTESPLSIVIADVEGKIEYVNEYFTRLTGYSQEEVIGKNPRILKSGTQDDRFYKDLWTTISEGETWKGEFQNKSKNGNLFWESATITPIKDDMGEITSFVAVKEDITIRKLMLQNISYNERFKDSIFSSIKEGLIVQDRDYKTLVANKSACEIFEMSLQKIKSVGPWDDHWKALSLDGKQIQNEAFPVVRAINEGIEVDNFVMNLQLGYKKRKYLSISSRPIFNENGEVIQAVSTFRDISELIESNQALIASEQKYRDLFELSADPSMIIKDGFIVDVNDAAVDLFGYYDKEQLIGKTPTEISPEVQGDGILSVTHFDKVNKLLDRRGSYRFEWIHKKSNGNLFPTDVMLTQINENGHVFTHVVVRDISDRKAQEQIILEQLKEKDILVAEIHHRVKNNLAVISGLIQLEVFKSKNENINRVLNGTVNRIKSIASIHEQIYSNEDFRNISLAMLIHALTKNHLTELQSTKKMDLDISEDLSEEVFINANQALPFGLLLDELLINYISLIESNEMDPHFSITLQKNDEDIHLTLNMKCDCSRINACNCSLDRTLIDVFISQLEGELNIVNHDQFKTEIKFGIREVNGTMVYQEV